MTVAATIADPRHDSRSNVFLAAALIVGKRSQPVRIRNISARGALIDGPNLPAEGTAFHLIRGRLIAKGEIAWERCDQCGLRFDEEVVVSNWVRKVGHAGQQRVDQIISLIRKPASDTLRSPLEFQNEDSLQSIAADLIDICERLASTPDFVATRAEELLRLDAVSQRLSRLAGT